ncbi:MAG: hypothetical protein ACXAC7_01510 [Candidatus Hodarchaeales archaeon]
MFVADLCFIAFIVLQVINEPETIEASLYVMLASALMGLIGIILIYLAFQNNPDKEKGLDTRPYYLIFVFAMVIMAFFTL